MIRVKSIGVKFPESFMYQTLLNELVVTEIFKRRRFWATLGTVAHKSSTITLSATCSRSVYYDTYTKIQTRCLSTNGTERGQSQEVT